MPINCAPVSSDTSCMRVHFQWVWCATILIIHPRFQSQMVKVDIYCVTCCYNIQSVGILHLSLIDKPGINGSIEQKMRRNVKQCRHDNITFLLLKTCRCNRHCCQYRHFVSGYQRKSVCYFRFAWATLLSDIAHGPRRSPWWILETTRVCRLGS